MRAREREAMSAKTFYAVVTVLSQRASSLRVIEAHSLNDAKREAARLVPGGRSSVRLFEHILDGPITPLAQLNPEDDGAWCDLVPSLVRGLVVGRPGVERN